MRRWNQNGTQRARFMEGRYGVDAFGRFLAVAGCVFIVVSLLLRIFGAGQRVTGFFGTLALVLVGYCYFRILSRNVNRRAGENQWYCTVRNKATGWMSLQKNRFSQRREYAFFRCPSCRQMARVPKGKGRIRITCRRCGYAFEKKT